MDGLISREDLLDDVISKFEYGVTDTLENLECSQKGGANVIEIASATSGRESYNSIPFMIRSEIHMVIFCHLDVAGDGLKSD